MSERFLTSDPSSIYGESGKALKKPPMASLTYADSPPSCEDVFSKKTWFAPICPREKLQENLNKIEEIGGVLFQILVQGNQVQVVYFQYEETND